MVLRLQDRSPTGSWFCFDDTSVEPWDPAKLDKDCFGGRFIPEGFTQVRGGVVFLHAMVQPVRFKGLPSWARTALGGASSRGLHTGQTVLNACKG